MVKLQLLEAMFLTYYSPNCFYHFTDERNLPSIREQGGLLSLAELRRRGVVPPAPGGNDWSHEADVRVGMDQYVHLCFINDHPMEFRARESGRIQRSRFLEIDPAVVKIDGVMFTADVSNKAGVSPIGIKEALATMDFPVIYTRLDWRDPDVRKRRDIAKKYELLVPTQVPLDMIRGI
ncbi:DarT ssDNA thymidine ADP-ribosyltransferase family protein [Pseudoxanthomonas mexicana]